MSAIKIVSKILIAVFSFFSILLILDEWLQPLSSYFFGYSQGSGYSVFSLASLMENFGSLAEVPLLEIIGYSFITLALAAIILNIVGTIISLATRQSGGTSTAAATVSLVLAFLFFSLVFYVNIRLEEEVYFIDEPILIPTIKPVLLIFTSMVVGVFSGILNAKPRSETAAPSYAPSYTPSYTHRAAFCSKCGNMLVPGTNYCPECRDLEVPVNTPSDSKKAHEEDLLRRGGWKCSKCGKVHPSYTGTCSCGNTKYTDL